MTLSSLQLNLPHTYIFNNFEGADLQKRDASCPMPSTQQPFQSQPQQPQQPSRQTYESQERYHKKSMPVSAARQSAPLFDSEVQESAFAGLASTVESGASGASVVSGANLDAGVLPVRVPALLIGDQFCFEGVLVHDKAHLTMRMHYTNRDWQERTIAGFVSKLSLVPLACTLIGVCVLGLAGCILWRTHKQHSKTK